MTTPAPSGVLLDVNEYSVGFRTERGLAQVVDKVSFQLERGSTLGIVGESGSGKSVLNRSLMGLISSNRQIEEGSALFDGEQLVGRDRQDFWGKRIGMIFQDPMTSLNPVMRIGRQIFEPLKQHLNMNNDQATERAIELLTQVGIPEPAAKRRPHEYSGGQCQRVSVARTLVLDPEIVICDEPVSALDVSVQAQILNMLEDMKERYGITLVFISHDLSVVRNVSDRLAVMYLGKMCEIGDGDLIYAKPAHPYTQVLLAALPDPTNPHAGAADALDSELPSPINPPSGCRFRTRCPYAQDICAEEEPQVAQVGTGDQWVACHFPLTA
ncbi:UNVERIFIED_CONTAM: hypothetical protein GTU68_049299 [Idotea baltica]|nr:hypothetical protein [Idotea baltica]